MSDSFHFKAASRRLSTQPLEINVALIDKLYQNQFYKSLITIYDTIESSIEYFSKMTRNDTLLIMLGPKLADMDDILEVCKKEVTEWNQQI